MSNNVKQYKLTLNRKRVKEIFEQIDGYHTKEITDIEKLIQGMLFIAEQKITAFDPNGKDVSMSMFDSFIENLIVATVERGSVAVKH